LGETLLLRSWGTEPRQEDGKVGLEEKQPKFDELKRVKWLKKKNSFGKELEKESWILKELLMLLA